MKSNLIGLDQKSGHFILENFEKSIKTRLLPHIPKMIETYHLTLVSLLWSILYILFSYFSTYNITWLWAASIIIILQYISDLFDGALGRYRKTGLIQWGFFMDHLLDYLFIVAIFLGHYLLAPEKMKFQVVIMLSIVSIGTFIIFLSYVITNEFRIYYFGIGPSELRFLVILFNVATIIYGTNHYYVSLIIINIIIGLSILYLLLNISKALWKLEMSK